jgi:hypothetical protein
MVHPFFCNDFIFFTDFQSIELQNHLSLKLKLQQIIYYKLKTPI